MIDGFDSFINYLTFEKRYSQHTITAYTKDIHQFNAYAKSTYDDLDIKHYTHHHLRSWIVFLLQNDITEKSINRKISSIKTFFKFLKRKGIIKTNPTAKITAPKIPKRVAEFVHESEMVRALDIIEWGDSEFSHLRNKLIFFLLYSGGLRRSELINIQLSDVDIINTQIKVLGKGAKERRITILPDLVKLMEDYLVLRNRLFGTEIKSFFVTEKGQAIYPKLVYKLVKEKLSSVTTIKKKSPHTLRHSFATHLSNNGAEINAIKELLGHSSLAATQIYTQNSIKQLKEAHKMHPRSSEK